MAKQSNIKKADLKANELKDVLRHVLNNNRKLEAEKKPKTTISIMGESGLGKTAIVGQIAKEFDLRLVKINLAQIDEAADLVGYPYTEFLIRKGDEQKWVSQNLIELHFKNDWEIPGDTRMSYAPPAWLVGDPGDTRGILLLLDDYSR